MTYAQKYQVVVKRLRERFPSSLNKLFKIKDSSQQVDAVNSIYDFLRRNIKMGCNDIDDEDIDELIELAKKSQVLNVNNDKQFLER